MRTLPLVLALSAVAACGGSGSPASAASAASTAAATAASPAASPAASVATPAAAEPAAPTPVVTSATSAATSTTACPTSYAQPDPLRPHLTATVDVTDGLVTGTEHFVFTPDLPVREIVLRLWAAAPRPASGGSRIDITSTKVDGTVRTARRTSPTVLHIPATAAAGQRMTIDVGFRLRLPTGVNDRFGHRGSTSWFGSGLPLLAWERGRGWALEPATSAFAEASTSEEMVLEGLTVTRARGLHVYATGTMLSDDGRKAYYRARSVRDIAVAVGAFRNARVVLGDKQVQVGVAPGLADSPGATARELARALKVHASRFGPFPYERLAVAVLPDIRGGIEYPGVVFLGRGQIDDATASHEVAHEWFYGLIGDDQGRDPWLDEAFATYAEALDRGTGPAYLGMTIPSAGRGHAGEPMTFWESRQSIYFRSVYIQGAQALLRARRAVGAAAFDRAIGCHVRRNAHRITRPADLAASLADLPAALRELRRVGAL